MAGGVGQPRWLIDGGISVRLPSRSSCRPCVASLLLLFANSFGAYATAYALTTGFISLVPISDLQRDRRQRLLRSRSG